MAPAPIDPARRAGRYCRAGTAQHRYMAQGRPASLSYPAREHPGAARVPMTGQLGIGLLDGFQVVWRTDCVGQRHVSGHALPGL